MSTPALSVTQLTDLLAIAKKAAAKAAAVINESIEQRAHRPLEVDEKSSSADLVTQYDKQCEALIMVTLQEECAAWHRRPENSSTAPFEFLGEESASEASVLTERPTWIVDPIDGTTSFVHGSFDCGVSIGLSINRMPVLGVVDLPRMGEVFWATSGGGAFCNGIPIRASGCASMSKALVSTHVSYNRSNAAITAIGNINRELASVQRVHGIRSYGSAAMDMCSVACGRLDLYFEAGIQAWDMCAATVIVREAGGVVSSLNRVDRDVKDFNLMGRAMACGATFELVETAVNINNKHCYREAILKLPVCGHGDSKL